MEELVKGVGEIVGLREEVDRRVAEVRRRCGV